MSDYQKYLKDAKNFLMQAVKGESGDPDFNVAAAQVWALMALAAAVGDVADARRSETGEQ